MSGSTDVSGFGKPFARDRSQLAIKAAFRRKWTLIGFSTFLLLVAIGLAVFNYASHTRERELTNAYLKTQSVFDEELKAFSERLSKMENLENAQDLTPDHSKSTPLYLEFATQYKEHPLGWQAALKAAQEILKEKKYDQAVSLLLPLLPQTRRFPILQVKVRQTLAGVYAEQGDYAKALGELALLEKIPENPFIDLTLLTIAQYTYLSGDKETAAKLLQDLANGKSGERNISPAISVEASTWLDFWQLNSVVQK